MATVQKFEHWTVKIEDDESPAQIIETLSQLPPDVKLNLLAENYQKIWLRFDKTAADMREAAKDARP